MEKVEEGVEVEKQDDKRWRTWWKWEDRMTGGIKREERGGREEYYTIKYCGRRECKREV